MSTCKVVVHQRALHSCPGPFFVECGSACGLWTVDCGVLFISLTVRKSEAPPHSFVRSFVLFFFLSLPFPSFLSLTSQFAFPIFTIKIILSIQHRSFTFTFTFTLHTQHRAEHLPAIIIHPISRIFFGLDLASSQHRPWTLAIIIHTLIHIHTTPYHHTLPPHLHTTTKLLRI